MGEALAAAVAGRLHAHQPGVLAVLHIADENAVLDQHCAIGRRAFIVDRKRAAAQRDGAVVDDGDPLRGDALTHESGERRGLLAVEIAFEPVAHRLVQHDAGPAGAEHDIHFAGWRWHRVQVGERLAHGAVGGVLPGVGDNEARVALAASIAGAAGFLPVACADHD